jgi:hypothetical protein
MECAGITDLANGSNLDASVRLRAGHLDNGAVQSNTGLGDRVSLRKNLGQRRDRDRIEVESTASHRLEVRIDEFTNHDDLSKGFVSVNNIWLEASQCLTARVDA